MVVSMVQLDVGVSKQGTPEQEKVQTVVIVGAGIAGLATALALHRCNQCPDSCTPCYRFLNIVEVCNMHDVLISIGKMLD